jgi:hypothetical protein
VAYRYFGTPLELYGFLKDEYLEYFDHGKGACRVQAWSVAALISSLEAAGTRGPEAPALAEAEAIAVSAGSSV